MKGEGAMVERSISAKGFAVNCLTQGSGPDAVMFMHGNPGDAWSFQGLLEALPADRYRGIAVNWYIGSDRPWGGYNVSGYVDQLRDVMDALDIPTATVGGHSLGGIAALVFALRYPDRVRKLVLIGTGATPAGHGRITKMIELLKSEASDREALTKLIVESYGTPPAPNVLERHIELAMRVDRACFLEAMISTLTYDLSPLLKYVDAPTLIVHGRHDKGRLAVHAQGLKEGIRNSELVVLDCGHTIMEEAPRGFIDSVLGFLAR